MSPRGFGKPLALIVLLAATHACGRADDAATLTELQKVRSGALDIVLLSPHDGLRHGKDAFVVEFRSASDQHLVDVRNVRGSANMPMSGAPMFGSIDIVPTAVAGRFTANAEFGMAGTWRMTIEWEGPTGQGSVTVAGTVR